MARALKFKTKMFSSEIIYKSMELEHINWDKIIRDNVKPKFISLNLKAIGTEMKLE